MRLLKYFLLLLVIPQFAFAYTPSFTATSTTGTIFVYPTAVNGILPALRSPFFFATSTTASSTFSGPVIINKVVGIGTDFPQQVNANAKLTVAGISSQDIVASTTDNTTLSDAIVQAYACGSRIFIGAHGSAQVATRYGITLGGWAEVGGFNSPCSGITLSGLVIGTSVAAPMVFGTNNIERMRILSTGFIGIATTTPGQALAIQGDQFIAGNITSTSTLASRFPYASSTAASASTYCLDFCITTWGSGTAGFPWTLKTVAAQTSTFSTTSLATTTSIWTQGVYFASSTLAASQFPYASSTMHSMTYASTTNLVIDIAGSSGTTCLQASATGNVTSTGSVCGGNVTINTAGILTGAGSGTTFNLNASSSPYLGYLFASSTTATSTFMGDVVFSKNTKYFMVGTSSGFYPQTIFSTSTSQLALSSGAGQPEWTFRSVGGYLFFSTTTNSGPATSTPAGITINGNAGSSGLLVGTTTNSAASGLAVAGTGYWTGLSASAGLQTGILCLSATNEIINESVACVASSRRFKNDIKPLETGISELLKLQPVSFYYKPEYNGALQKNANYSGEQVGFISEQVTEVDPRLATVEPDGVTPHGVRYEQMSALIVKAVQEMWQKVTGIDDRVKILEKENANLKARLDKAGL